MGSKSVAGGPTLGPAVVRFLVAVAIVTLILANPWTAVVRGAIADRLYSYALLVPFISGWLVWQKRPNSLLVGRGDAWGGVGFLTLATGLALAGIFARRTGWITSETSWLTTQIGAWVLATWGLALALLGRSWVVSNIFPVCFLAFTVPLPEPLVDVIEVGLQHASANFSDFLFRFARTPYSRDGLTFWFPGVRISVAPECSGIRSTLVLLITGILGSYLLLKRPVHRLALVALIVPLGILRNAIRILTLTLLSVHWKPEIMHSALHHRGGPLFFAVSLVPLFVLFWWLARRERRAAAGQAVSH